MHPSINDTIFAPATAAGRSGVAVLRISGTQAAAALAMLGAAIPPPRMATLAQLRHPETADVIDQALLLWFPAPASFTGEDVAELHVHGSQAVLKALCTLLANLPGLRLAEPGEFARRAFLHGKMDLTEAEGLADLIEAQTEGQLYQAINQMQGIMRKRYEAMRAAVIRALALLEAYIDFPEEEIPASVIDSIDTEMHALAQTIDGMLADHARGERIREGISVVILGAPNAGKSSLINALAQREVAIVAASAGTTRDVLEAQVNIGGYAVSLLDTAGLRDAADEVEKEGIRRARAKALAADLTLILLDGSALPARDAHSLGMITERSVVILSKADALRGPVPSHIGGVKPLLLSVKENTGLEELHTAIVTLLDRYYDFRDPPMITRLRHRRTLDETHFHLLRAMSDLPLELKCEELRLAATEIGKMTGKIVTDEILDVVFREFCIGK
ncbi:MAG: tRNA uridine-5-carboxymethylaminomethyl(34) synthesis GTPase MnmE [Alphaproteobacteria bacterium]|nr:tRNA uridine-5-carboxymethylaminomethyl(34) synthesis GTPase MnmE [Alphaproteobacteria bacterium]